MDNIGKQELHFCCVSTKTTFFKRYSSTHRQPTSRGMRESQHSIWDSSVILFWNGFWHRRTGHKFWSTNYALDGAGASVANAANLQKTFQEWCNRLWPILGNSGYYYSLSHKAVAFQIYWLWKWRHMCREHDTFYAGDIYEADLEWEL